MFPLPSLELKTVEEDAFLGRYTIEPLHPGYGIMIGNSLRRVLLSSIMGAAPVAVRIEGVPHEFSVIEGVVEDVVQIILNLKKLVVGMDSDEVRTLTLDVSGERVVTAADIIPDAGVTIVNPELHIAELSSPNSQLRMDILVAKNRGYVPTEKNKRGDYPIGTIWMDAMFTPVKNVKFTVEQTLIEQYLDFERLNIDILCNGAIQPKDSLNQALQILSEYFSAIAQPDILRDSEGELESSIDDKLDMSLDIVVPNISPKTHHLLIYAGIKTLRDLLMKEQNDITAIKGITTKMLKELVKAVESTSDYQVISQYAFPFITVSEEEEAEAEVEEVDIEAAVEDEEPEVVEQPPAPKAEAKPVKEDHREFVVTKKEQREEPPQVSLKVSDLNFTLDDLALSKSTRQFLTSVKINTLDQLLGKTRKDLMQLSSSKDKVVNEIEKRLDQLDLKLVPDQVDAASEEERTNKLLSMDIEEFKEEVVIPKTNLKHMEQANIATLGDLVELGKSGMKGQLKMTAKTIEEIEKRLEKMGLQIKE
ncbi:MAG: DNA-directed RNA polymerase subunit alpha [Caldisericia bacterium]|nr:DNA-directed RNA polymerase subunit alpha [Caldisericia bacterium]